MLLVRDDSTGLRIGRIVETEAYAGPEDRASHARFASTARNAVMSGRAGLAYVYLVYGMYDCLNVVTGSEGSAGAVLIRAVEPLRGVDVMRTARLAAVQRRRRGVGPDHERLAAARLARLPDHHLARGPGLVGACFGVDASWTGIDLCDADAPLRLAMDEASTRGDFQVATGPRVGVAYAGPGWAERPWRFAIAGHPSVSRAR